MAREVTHQADLILFVVSGDITRTEYEALLDLRQSQKPLILVFNKTDLYPDTDKKAIYANLQQLAAGSSTRPLIPDEIVMVAAEPAPMEVRVEYADGREDYEWETLPPQVDQLQQTILKILNREGRSLLSLNALVQARDAEESIAYKTLGNYAQAIEANQQSLKIIQELGNHKNEAKVLNNLCNTYEALGDYEKAIASYNKKTRSNH